MDLREKLAGLAREAGDLERARHYLEEVVSLSPRRIEARKLLVEVYLRGNPAAALQESQALIEAAMQARDYGFATDLLSRLIESAPDQLSCAIN